MGSVPDDITPTEYLMMETLVARFRLGELFWTFPSKMIQTARRLDGRGFIFWSSGIAADTIRVSLCNAGLEAWGVEHDDGRPVVPKFTASREESRVKLIHPLPAALSDEEIRNFQSTVRGGPGARTYPIHGSDSECIVDLQEEAMNVVLWLRNQVLRRASGKPAMDPETVRLVVDDFIQNCGGL
jgi:hypothetical protein